MTIRETPVEEMTTEQIQAELNEVRTELEKIKHIGKGSGMTPRYWRLVARELKLSQPHRRSDRSDNPEK